MKRLFSVLMAVLLLSLSITTVFAAGTQEFVPSVTGKFAPTVIKNTDGDYGKAYDENNNVVYTADETDITTISLTSAATSNKPLNQEIQTAYVEISAAQSLIDVVEGLDKIVDKRFPKTDADNLAVTSIFGLDFSNRLKNHNPAYVSMTFDFKNYTSGDAPIIIFKALGSNKWVVIDEKNVSVNKDGTLQVTFAGEAGVVAFLEQTVAADSDDVDDDTAISSGKCCRCPRWCFACRFLCTDKRCYCWLVLVVILIIVIYFIFKKKKDKKDKIERK